MFYILSRFAAMLASPVIYLVGLLLIAVFVESRKVKRVCLLGVLFLFLLFTNNFVYEAAERWWTRDTLSSMKEGKVYTYGVVLGGFGGYNPESDQLDFNRSADRLWEAIQLYKAGRIRKIVIASDGTTHPDYGNAQTFIRQMSYLDIPATDILIEKKALNTDENAIYTLQMLPDLKTEPFLLITSAVHMRRSLDCFRAAGMNPDYHSTDRFYEPISRWESWVPDLTLLDEWYSLGHEWIGTVSYEIALRNEK